MRRVKRALIPLVLLAGCSVHSQSVVGSGQSSVSTHGSVQVQIDGGSGAAAVLGIGLFAAGMYSYERWRTEAPTLAADRAVSEQDCTQPLELTRGNLRCR